jgi:hypothetical protein
MPPAELRRDLRSFLIDEFGAIARRSWGLDALYYDDRLFVLFDGDDLVGKWPRTTRERLRAEVTGVRAFMDEDDAAEASWLRVPLSALVGLDAAMALALGAADYVHTTEGSPKKRRRRSAD